MALYAKANLTVAEGDTYTSDVITLREGDTFATSTVREITGPLVVDCEAKNWHGDPTVGLVTAAITNGPLGQFTLTVDAAAFNVSSHVYKVRDTGAATEQTILSGHVRIVSEAVAAPFMPVKGHSTDGVFVDDTGSPVFMTVAGPAGADGAVSAEAVQAMIDASMAEAGLDEIGRGSVLPLNGDTYDIFELQANGTAPDGVYRWDHLAFAWVQIG